MKNHFFRNFIIIILTLIFVGLGFFFVSSSNKNIGKIVIKGQLDLCFKGNTSIFYKDILPDKTIPNIYENFIICEINYMFKNFNLSKSYKEENIMDLIKDFKIILSNSKYKIKKADEHSGFIIAYIETQPTNIFKKLSKDYQIIKEDIKKEGAVAVIFYHFSTAPILNLRKNNIKIILTLITILKII